MKHFLKKGALLLLTCVCWVTSGYTQASKKALTDAFNKHQALVAGRGQVCHAANVVVGDLDGDGVNDGVVQYVCLMAGGNIPVYTGWTMWLSKNGELKPVLHRNDLGQALPLSIGAGGVISALVYKHKKGDASCCPSIKTPKKFQLKRQKIINTVYYELNEVK
jgi:hypothetical protein